MSNNYDDNVIQFSGEDINWNEFTSAKLPEIGPGIQVSSYYLLRGESEKGFYWMFKVIVTIETFSDKIGSYHEYISEVFLDASEIKFAGTEGHVDVRTMIVNKSASTDKEAVGVKVAEYVIQWHIDNVSKIKGDARFPFKVKKEKK